MTAEEIQEQPLEVVVDGLGFGYTDVPVLHDISFRIEGRGLTSILGPNGVGKSTLMHCMNKILKPTQGTVCINGRDVAGIPLRELAKIIGYVPYSAQDSFPMSVVDTVLMGRHPYSKWRSSDSDLGVVYDTLTLLGIEDLAERNFNELSAGQHQKVMLARGLVQEPRLLLLDEPTANLDVKHQMEVTRMLRKISREKDVAVLMICHDINIAAKFSDDIIILSEGTVFTKGKPSEVITADNLSAVYDVKAEIIDDHGSPHMILNEPAEAE